MTAGRERLVGRGAVVVLIWAGINAVLASVLFIFSAHVTGQQLVFYWSAVGLLVVTAIAVWVLPLRNVPSEPRHRGGQTANGAPSAALAAAALIGGLAWVFGVFLAWFCVPLLAFCLARWRVEHQLRKQRAP